MPETRRGDQPAFPTESADQYWHGMSLRDWFAGQALIGLCSQDAILAQVSVSSGQNPARIAAAAAYIAADDMLAALRAMDEADNLQAISDALLLGRAAIAKAEGRTDA